MDKQVLPQGRLKRDPEKVGSGQGASVKWPSGVGPCAGRSGPAPWVQSWVCTPARPRGDFRSGVPLFLPGPPEPSSSWASRWRSFLTRPWLSLSVPSVHPPTSTTPSWRRLAPALRLADPGHLPTATPATLSRSWVPVEPAALLHGRVLPHLSRCRFSQRHFQPFCSTVWGTELNGSKTLQIYLRPLILTLRSLGRDCAVFILESPSLELGQG